MFRIAVLTFFFLLAESAIADVGVGSGEYQWGSGVIVGYDVNPNFIPEINDPCDTSNELLRAQCLMNRLRGGNLLLNPLGKYQMGSPLDSGCITASMLRSVVESAVSSAMGQSGESQGPVRRPLIDPRLADGSSAADNEKRWREYEEKERKRMEELSLWQKISGTKSYLEAELQHKKALCLEANDCP
ncbi:hypothetical protein ACLUTX_12410 [Enterobacterales bacterium AE_CKDN230030158-1A_HGKHYDSX7]